jgi:hypothetical protein
LRAKRIGICLGATALGLGVIYPSFAVERRNYLAPTARAGDVGPRELVAAREADFPQPDTAVAEQWDNIRSSEAARWRNLLPGGGQLASLRQGARHNALVSGADTTPAWLNVGPSDVLLQSNGNTYDKFESGRPVAVIVDPRNPDVVYDAASSGGLWKTTDFVSGYPNPRWVSVSDGLPSLSVGAFGLDPSHPDTLYLVTGDAFDSRAGVSVYKSVNGGGTWSDPVPLTAPYPGLAAPYRPLSSRDVQVDPTNANNVMVSTLAGLFRSTDGGKTFTWVNLPNGATNQAEATWSITYTGGTTWLVSGITACAALPAAAPFPAAAYPPRPGFGVVAGATCTSGNLGDIWRSTDSGATWTSLRYPATGVSTLPAAPTGDAAMRISLAAGKTTDPAKTTIYAYVGNSENDPVLSHKTLGFWRSRDGGLTWADATGALANPTLASGECADMNIGHDQTYYNQSIAVDPTNDDNVIAGGNLCSVRTLSGTAASPKWENSSFWLTTYQGAYTAAGKLPYAHADWHATSVAIVNGKPLVIVGNDGGVYSSPNVFDPSVPPPSVTWNPNNRGIVTHLAYGVGSGDPTTGNGYVSIIGMQDIGTWVRPTAEVATGYLDLFPTTYNGVYGGDGIGSALSTGTKADLWYVSSEFTNAICDNTHSDCTSGASYFNVQPPTATSDSDPFFVYYAPVSTDPTGLTTLTHSTHQVWRSQVTPGVGTAPPMVNAGTFQWVAASPDFSTINPRLTVLRPVSARLLANVTGVVFRSRGLTLPVVAVNTNGAADAASWTLSKPFPLSNGLGVTSASAMDFANAASAGKAPGDELVAASNSVFLSDGVTPVPDTLGHVFASADRGQTWKIISGTGGASALPNVPVFAIKYDPSDATSKTIYAGTLIGVYVTTDAGATWSRYGAGMPFVQVTELYVAKNNDFLRASTYGRGLWEVYPSANQPRGTSGDGDFDMNGQIDWIDVAAVASRLGVTPGTVAAPRYNQICDIVSPDISPSDGTNPATPAPKASIKDADLAAVLTTFAGNP